MTSAPDRRTTQLLRSFVALARWAGYDVTLTPTRKAESTR